MILRASIKNLYSFRDETEVSFVAGKSKTHISQVVRAGKRDDISVLKAGVVYGANASGKSNIIKAMYVLQQIALGGVPRKLVEPFKLSTANEGPSRLEIEFKVGKMYYAYGVEFTIKGIVEEWLYEINNRSDKEVFARKVVAGENMFTFKTIPSADTRQLLKYVSQSTPLTDSFLSEYVRRNGKGLDAISETYAWMKYSLKIIFPQSRFTGISIRIEKDKEFALATQSLLEYFNTGIVDIRSFRIKKEELDLPKEVADKVVEEAEPNTNIFIASPAGDTIYYFETNGSGVTTIYKQCAIHKNESGEDIPFEMSEESEGSIRLLDFIPMLIDLRLNDAVYLVDEIDRSMHPMLSQKLLEYYFAHLSPERDTQLIFSTHESHLLDLNLLRADEVWFVEKDKEGASRLTSLAEYKPREDVRKGYLQGRYGAIPFFAPIKSLKW